MSEPARETTENAPRDEQSRGAASPATPAVPGDAAPAREPRVDDFLGEPTRDLADWRWLWGGDHRFPVRSHRGLVGRLVVAWKKLFRPFVSVPQNDLWERQRIFNLIVLEHLQNSGVRLEDVRARGARLEALMQDGLDSVVRQQDALYSRVDAKLDSYRADARELLAWARSALIASGAAIEGGEISARAAGIAETAPPMPVATAADELRRAFEERGYIEFERRFRGTEAEIHDRIAAYLPYLTGASPLLDLGCGRGEALRVFRDGGLVARGVDSSGEMVAHCRAQGLDAVESDLLAYLAQVEAGSLGAVVSFHVIEHLPPEVIVRLVALAWRALRPRGVLVLETPNPLSVVVAARSFWLDPTHHRPVHPDFLRELARQQGFDDVEVLPLRPFAAADRLPEIPLAEVPPQLHALADRVNRLRDRLDDVLFGHQDYGLVARKA